VSSSGTGSQTILVTGGTGFVGRRLMRLLVQTYGAENILCLAYDKADNELERSGRAILDEMGVRYIPVELVSGRGLDKVPHSPKMVFHLAAITDTGVKDHSINDVGTRNLVEAISPLPPSSHFVFTSTIAVSDNRVKPEEPASEGAALKPPYHVYGRRKLAVEHYLTERSRRDGFKVTMIRLCAVFGGGPKQDGLYDSIRRLAEKDSLVVRLDWPGVLSITDVDDIANILVTVSKDDGRPNTVDLYVPVGESLTVAELAQHYYRALGKPYRQIKMPGVFWSLTRLATRICFALSPVLPHSFNNKVWQFSLLVTSGFHNESSKFQHRYPELHLKKFADSVGGMI
jgi:nucleoside-diphosphate-sugar epimerase